MLQMIKKIWKYKNQTLKYPLEPMDAHNFIGRPTVDTSKCRGESCSVCMTVCPTGAIVLDDSGKVGINLTSCIFCSRCADDCPSGSISMSNDFELSSNSKSDLIHFPSADDAAGSGEEEIRLLIDRIDEKAKARLGRSLQIREIDAGSCNGCDYEINALNNPFNDIERFGFHFVASPRHADMFLVTGCPTRNMEDALVKTIEASPDPRIVVAVGACACSGGIFRDSYATKNGIDKVVSVHTYVPGCPPRPQAILHGILKSLDRI